MKGVTKGKVITTLVVAIIMTLWSIVNIVFSILYAQNLQVCFPTLQDWLRSCSAGGRTNMSYSPYSPILYYIASVVFPIMLTILFYIRYHRKADTPSA